MSGDPEIIKRNIRNHEGLLLRDAPRYAPADPNRLLEAAKARLSNVEADKSHRRD
jgi:hypothetical protein